MFEAGQEVAQAVPILPEHINDVSEAVVVEMIE
jgi:hypothetical protein